MVKKPKVKVPLAETRVWFSDSGWVGESVSVVKQGWKR